MAFDWGCGLWRSTWLVVALVAVAVGDGCGLCCVAVALTAATDCGSRPWQWLLVAFVAVAVDNSFGP